MAEIRDPEIFRTVLDNLATGVYLADCSGTILFWNHGAEQITGHLGHEVLGHSRNESILTQCNEQNCWVCGGDCPFRDARRDGKPRELRLSLHHKAGHSIPVLFRIAPIRDAHGSIRYLAGSFEQQQRIMEDRQNPRTPIPADCLDESGVANHGFIQFHLRESLAEFAEYKIPFSILCLELDRFDHFRTTYGRQAADAIARAVGETLHDSLRPDDFVGRWAEDQFLAILSNCGSPGAAKAAERIQRTVAQASIQWWGDRLNATTHVEHATVQPGDTMQTLVRRAQPLQQPKTGDAAAAAGGSGSPGN